ncbi:hypothetical protein TI39_contig684g00006 [Zymoseptoria brevis]|uniref:F-box domain-containing protein n=1 Tax=Zymoseptoria brevis TaxID=1047168 RepID=A0A0F4GFS1_9PEZI|nr:hypothetical protein TI39_contig684g00006 [Zymoseptoria brevis]
MRLRRAILRTIRRRMAAVSTTFQFALLELPTELLVSIIEQIDSIDALRRLAICSRQLQGLTEPLIYHRLLLRNGRRTEQIVRSSRARPDRAIAIRTLVIACETGVPQSFGPSGIAGVLNRALRLETLYFESPECNSANFEPHAPWTYMFNRIIRPFQDATASPGGSLTAPRPLQCLKKLTIHMNGASSPYWTIDQRSASIFLLPALETLKISCVIIEDSLSSISRAHSSPLKHLELDEVYITLQGLESVLQLPTALETLILLENMHNANQFPIRPSPTWNRLFQNNPGPTMKCIDQQRASLKSFTYGTTDNPPFDGGGRLAWRDPTPVDGAFADFPFLEEVCLNVWGECISFERAVLSSSPPPNLKKLAYVGSRPFSSKTASAAEPQEASSPMSQVPFLRAPASSLPRGLRSICMSYSRPPLSSFHSTSLLGRTIKAVDAELHKIGEIALEVTAFEYNRYFPPFLYGEPTPKEIGIFRDGRFQEDFQTYWNEDGDSDGESEGDLDLSYNDVFGSDSD